MSSSLIMHLKFGSLTHAEQHQNNSRIDLWLHSEERLAENQRLDYDMKNQDKLFWNNRVEGIKLGNSSGYHLGFNNWKSMQSNEWLREQYQHSMKWHL